MYLIEPITEQVKDWIKDSVVYEPWQWLGNNLAIDHHYIEDLVFGLSQEGFEVGRDFNVIHA